MTTTSKPNYFNPHIFKKVLEHILLPPKHFQRSQFLFPEIAPLMEEHIKAKKAVIQDILLREIDYQEEVYLGYVGEEAKERWFSQLREDYELPSDYEFE